MLRQRIAAVNVDVDSLYLYYRIHGLDDSGAADAVWERGVTRFMELFDQVGLKATFFVVGQDLAQVPSALPVAEALVRAGHELASHSHTHPYNMSRLGQARILEEVTRAREAIGAVRGKDVVGFRAPGYVINDAVLDALNDSGYRYDTSLFPCPPYYLAKAAIMGLMRLQGRRSESILDAPSVMWAKTEPHRRRGVIEFPVTVLPYARLPFIGTSLLMMGRRGYDVIRPWLSQRRFVNLEFHGIDLCDLQADRIDPVLSKQPDLRVPLSEKWMLFRRVLADLKDGWGVRTLEEIAESLER